MIADYYVHMAKKAKSITDDRRRFYAMLDIAHRSARVGVPCPVIATEEALTLFKSLNMKKTKGRPFVDPLLNARISGQMEVLCEHFAMKTTSASELIALVHSDDQDKPRDPSGIRRIYGQRKKWHRLASIESCGVFTFATTGDPEVDSMLFTSKEVRVLMQLIRDDEHPVKQITDFFHRRT